MHQQPSSPLISVIIRNRNEAKHLRRVLEALVLQQEQSFEIVIVDNESEDESVEVGKEFGARIITLPRSLFTYGRALNMGLQAARGEICILLSAHSLPIGSGFLTECARPFSDERIAGVRCLHMEKSRDIERWTRPEVLSYPIDLDTIISKGPLASGCAIRRRVWEEIPFNEDLIAAEEKLWTLEVLRKGYLIYSPCSAAYYYMKRLPLFKIIIKNDREIAAVYAQEGFRPGFAKRRTLQGIADIFRAMLYGAPSAAIKEVMATALRSYLSLSLYLRTKQSSRNDSSH